jgi:TonB family protein
VLVVELELLDKGIKSKIRKYVLGFHFILILVLLISSFVDFTPKKKKVKFTAQIIELPATKEHSKSEPVKKEVKSSKPQKKVERKIKQKPKPVVKKSHKTIKKVKKKTWKPLSASDIVVNKPKVKHVKKPTVTKVSINKPQIKISSRIKVDNPTTSNSNQKADFYDKVGAILYQNWEPPASAKLLSYTPQVTIKIYLTSSGRITSWKIITPSTVSAVNSSVSSLMEIVKTLPPPPVGLRDVEVTLKVK